MRFMMLVRADKMTESGTLPDEKALAAMGKYNEEMQKAGVLLDLSGLHPSQRGARVRFSGGKPSVTDGPFAEAKEMIAGYWLIQVKSREEAIEWAKRVPFVDGELELRQVVELSDFPASPAIDRAVELGKKLGKV
jgi:hypothetical protein